MYYLVPWLRSSGLGSSSSTRTGATSDRRQRHDSAGDAKDSKRDRGTGAGTGAGSGVGIGSGRNKSRATREQQPPPPVDLNVLRVEHVERLMKPLLAHMSHADYVQFMRTIKGKLQRTVLESWTHDFLPAFPFCALCLLTDINQEHLAPELTPSAESDVYPSGSSSASGRGSGHCAATGTNARQQPSPALLAAMSILRRERFARLSAGVGRRRRSGDAGAAASGCAARSTSGVRVGRGGFRAGAGHRGGGRGRRRSRIRVVLMKRRRRGQRPTGLSAGVAQGTEFGLQTGAGALAFNATGQVIPLLWRIQPGTRDYADRLSHLQDSN